RCGRGRPRPRPGRRGAPGQRTPAREMPSRPRTRLPPGRRYGAAPETATAVPPRVVVAASPVASAKLMRTPRLPRPRCAGLQAAGPGDRLRGNQRSADLELDLGMLRDRDVSRVAVVGLAVVDHRDVPLLGADLIGPQRLAPNAEEVAQREGAVDRRLGVDD